MSQRDTQSVILIVEDDPRIRGSLKQLLMMDGHEVVEAANGREGLRQVAEIPPNLIISDVMMPELTGIEMLRQLRADPATAAIPLILLTATTEKETMLSGLNLGADDFLLKPFEFDELEARVRAKLARPPNPAETVPYDLQTGMINAQTFRKEVARELARVRRGGNSGVLAYLELAELAGLHERLGTRSNTQISRQIAQIIMAEGRDLDLIGREKSDRFALLLPETSATEATARLARLARRIAVHVFQAGSENIRLTPAIGFAPLSGAATLDELQQQAIAAIQGASEHLDLHPFLYSGARTGAEQRARASRLRQLLARAYASFTLPIQLAVMFTLFFMVPLSTYVVLYEAGIDITPHTYIVIVVALLLTAVLIWTEGLLALNAPEPPPAPTGPRPAASAIIAAYLPNEAATIVETVEALLRQDYTGALQIILAYNTPRDLPVEALLHDLARRDWRFVPLRVHGSTSKAQNVNAALAHVTGEFVGIFDADHHPDPDSFTRAWRWLAAGYDIVQGHCVVRNGHESWVARNVAVEFEAIYAVSHPGRASLHQFGIFGGSNGYWRTSLLREMRLYGFMLTEDIDSSIRVIEAGYRIASDPHLISRELATTTLKAFCNQRLRWAQGWFQVSLRHSWKLSITAKLPWRQRLGIFQLLVWREMYPWIAFQMVPLICFLAWRGGGLSRIDWFIPLFVLTTMFTQSVAVGQALITYRLADPAIRKHGSWFLLFMLISFVLFTPLKNLIAMLAQIKEFMRERQWKVTPRGS